jgi:DNA modification methylase
VAVQRTDLDVRTDVRAQTLAIADNRVGELDLEWDVEMLQQLHADGMDLSPFWTNEEMSAMFDAAAGGTTTDDAVTPPTATDIITGDLFILGRHRMLCGDATSAADVRRLLDGATPTLMTADPPYGVNYSAGWRHAAYPSQRTAIGSVANDDRADWGDAWRLLPGAVAYVWHAALKAAAVATSLESAGFRLRSQIIWAKQHFALSRGDYHWGHEPAWYAVRTPGKSHWQGDRTQSTVWTVPNLNAMGGTRSDDNAPTGHSTQKPVRLFEIPILNHTTRGEAVYDPFVGSGTTLIAAEKTGRVAYVMDVDARYVQAAVTRWEQFTGKQATRSARGAKKTRRS